MRKTYVLRKSAFAQFNVTISKIDKTPRFFKDIVLLFRFWLDATKVINYSDNDYCSSCGRFEIYIFRFHLLINRKFLWKILFTKAVIYSNVYRQTWKHLHHRGVFRKKWPWSLKFVSNQEQNSFQGWNHHSTYVLSFEYIIFYWKLIFLDDGFRSSEQKVRYSRIFSLEK